MSINIEKIIRLNNLVGLTFRTKHIIVLDPNSEQIDLKSIDDNIIYDKANWKIPEKLSKFVKELSQNKTISDEDKILLIFEEICKDYVYDDNLISYIKEIEEDVFYIPDWYGQDIDQEWEKNREGHNRRVCYELSRYLARALTELFKNNNDYNICIHWNKNLTHYFVGLTCEEYSISLDLDNFFNIKDLTRLKTGLTAEGITVLEDKENKFKKALDKFNENRSEHAIKNISDQLGETEHTDYKPKSENEDITFLRKALEILTKKYNIDSQGIFEYIKEIVDIRLGSNEREKIWKRLDGNTKESTRYIRCLVVNIENKKYLIDVDEKILRPFDEKELKMKRACFIPYNALSRGGFDYYDGT